MFRSVLLIDDNDMENHINKGKIERCHFAAKVQIAKTAMSGIEFLKTFSKTPERLPEIIFLDVLMPEVDGFGFLEMYNELSDFVKLRTRIIMLTASIDFIDFRRAMSNPYVYNYLKKPLNIEELLAMAA